MQTARSCPWILLLLFCARAHGQWNDPNFREGVKAADLIAVGKVATSTAVETRTRVDRVLAGEAKPGDEVAVLRAPLTHQLEAFLPLPVGADFLFCCKRDPTEKGKYVASSDTWWAFAVENGLVYLPVRDPFARAHVKVDHLAALVPALRAGKPDEAVAALCDELAHGLQESPEAKDPAQAESQVFALEVLHHFGQAKHIACDTPLLRSPHVQVRWSCVRALRTCQGAGAAPTFLEFLPTEQAPEVLTTIGYTLFTLAPKSGRETVVEAIRRASTTRIKLGENLIPAVTNSLPSPRENLLLALMRMDGEEGSMEQLLSRTEEYWKKVEPGQK